MLFLVEHRSTGNEGSYADSSPVRREEEFLDLAILVIFQDLLFGGSDLSLMLLSLLPFLGESKLSHYGFGSFFLFLRLGLEFGGCLKFISHCLL